MNYEIYDISKLVKLNEQYMENRRIQYMEQYKERYYEQLKNLGWSWSINKEFARSNTGDLFKVSKNNMSIYCGIKDSTICHINVFTNANGMDSVDRELLYVGYGEIHSKNYYDYILDSFESFMEILKLSNTYENLIMRLEQNVLENLLDRLDG